MLMMFTIILELDKYERFLPSLLSDEIRKLSSNYCVSVLNPNTSLYSLFM